MPELAATIDYNKGQTIKTYQNRFEVIVKEVNGEKRKPNYKLREGDRIVIIF